MSLVVVLTPLDILYTYVNDDEYSTHLKVIWFARCCENYLFASDRWKLTFSNMLS